MRAIVMLIFLLIAGNCWAEDPLETLNTVEDTLSTMERTLGHPSERAERAVSQAGAGSAGAREPFRFGPELYFVSDESLGVRGWVKVRLCSAEETLSPHAPAAESCSSQRSEAVGVENYYWKGRAAQAAELRPGLLVVARDTANDGEWYLSRITGISEIDSGFVALSAPFRAQLTHLRIVVP